MSLRQQATNLETAGLKKKKPGSPLKLAPINPLKLSEPDELFKKCQMRMVECQIDKTRADRTKILSQMHSPSKQEYDACISYRKAPVNSAEPSAVEKIATSVYDGIVLEGINVFMDTKDLPKKGAAANKDLVWQMSKCRHIVVFLSERSMQLIKKLSDAPTLASRRDPMLKEYEDAVQVYKPENIILVQVGKWMDAELAVKNVWNSDEVSVPGPRSYEAFADDPDAYFAGTSASCTHRSIRKTMSLLFESRNRVNCDPDAPEEAVKAVVELLKQGELREQESEVAAGAQRARKEDDLCSFIGKAADICRREGHGDQQLELVAMAARLRGDRLLEQASLSRGARDYTHAEALLRDAGAHFRHLRDPVHAPDPDDALASILVHEDHARRRCVKNAHKRVVEMAVEDALAAVKDAKRLAKSQNFCKALGLLHAAKAAYGWAGMAHDVTKVGSVEAVFSEQQHRLLSERRAHEAHLAALPRAEEVDILFRQKIRDDPGDIEAAFKTIDLDGSGELDFKEFSMLLDGLGFQMLPSERRKLLRKYDPDGDGISYMEFIQLQM